jgi:para-nitrobenzyl esterase
MARTLLVALVAVGVFPGALAEAQTVKTRAGLVSGTRGTTPQVTVFRGVPYAAPPVGDLRWAPPALLAPWTGVRLADRFAPSCMQNIVTERKPWTHEFMAHGAISEDCLHLNIWTPRPDAAANLPVYVFLHGGGFGEGSGSVAVYDGEGLAKKNLVVVTVNYRLGVLGFLAHPELTRAQRASGGRGGSGNYGLHDMIAALRWVRENINGFGGDVSRVTIAGQSAGGVGVLSLMASPLAKGLFHRAVVESGLVVGDEPSLAQAEAAGVAWATAKGATTLAALRGLGALVASTRVEPPPGAAPAARSLLRPIVDGVVLTEGFSTLMARGLPSDVPVLIGANLDEGSGEQQRVTLTEWAAARAAASKAKTFTYFWTHPPPGPDAAQYKAFHTSEVPYAMNALSMSDRPFTDIDRRVADVMSSYWANFAKNGDPNGQGLAPWPASTDRPSRIMHIGAETSAKPVYPATATR